MFTVTWTPDAPDDTPHTGKTVVFSPNPTHFEGLDGDTTVGSVEGVIDATGALTAKAGGPLLLKWKSGLQYQVRLIGVGLAPFWFDVETHVADGGTLDLADVVPSAGAALVPTQYAELDARMDVLEAAPPGSAPDATTTSKGIVQLAGDLGGTAAAPTVPGLAGKANTVHTHAPADVTGTAVITTDPRLSDARTPLAHTQAAATITDLTETVQDIVGALIVAGTGTTVTYDDAAGTFTITSTATGGSTDPEIVRDVIGGALVAGSGIQITVNDAGDTITVASTAVLPTRQVNSGTGLTGGGDLSANRTLAVSYGTTAGTAAQGNDARLSDARTPTAHAASHASAGSDPVSPASIGAAAASHTHTSADVTDFTEAAQDVVGAMVTGAGGTYNDTAGTITLPSGGSSTPTINAQTGTAYTLVAGDAGNIVTLTNAAAITLTVPASVFTAGQRVDCIVLGAGMVTVVAGAGATVNGTPSLVSRAQHSAFTVQFLSASTAVVVGDLA